jgi:hypothetical protein
MNMLHVNTGPTLDSAPARFPALKKLHLKKEALRTLTGSEKLLLDRGRSMRPECLTTW